MNLYLKILGSFLKLLTYYLNDIFPVIIIFEIQSQYCEKKKIILIADTKYTFC